MRVWESRCYFDGIPDCVPAELIKSNRVPSYKAIAMAILKNDLILKSLGFEGKSSLWYSALKDKKKKELSNQYDLF